MNPRCIDNEMKQTDYPQDYDKMGMDMNQGCMCPPVYECPETRICERYIVHEVPQE